MYHDYFGLNQAPFKITPDTSLFFPGGNRGAVLEALIYAITSGEGIVKVVGEVGSGKTMLCRMLEIELPENVEVVYLANPSLSPDNILHAIAFELEISVDESEDRLKVMHELQEYLLKKHAANCQVVVFVEEAQSMPIATLEEIRLLSNLETEQNKLLQIVLFGQPELDQTLAKKEIRQLKERITYSFYLNPFKLGEVKEYLNARLRACGYRSTELFSLFAIREITKFSEGLLRRINILADKSMLAAYAVNTHKVTRKHVKVAARDSEFVTIWQRYRLAMLCTTIIIILFGTFWLFPVKDLQHGLNISKQGMMLNSGSNQNNVTQLSVKEKKQITTIYHQQDDSHYYDYFSKAGLFVQESVSLELDEGMSVNVEEPRSLAIKNKVTVSFSVDSNEEEANVLRQQLEQLPPEVAINVEDENTCELCTSIIYRPLTTHENL